MLHTILKEKNNRHVKEGYSGFSESNRGRVIKGLNKKENAQFHVWCFCLLVVAVFKLSNGAIKLQI